EVGKVVAQRLLDTATQGLALVAGCGEVLFEAGVVAHGQGFTYQLLGHQGHAATPLCFPVDRASWRSAKNCRTLAHCASLLSRMLNWTRNSRAPGWVARYQPTCLRAIRTPITSP